MLKSRPSPVAASTLVDSGTSLLVRPRDRTGRPHALPRFAPGRAAPRRTISITNNDMPLMLLLLLQFNMHHLLFFDAARSSVSANVARGTTTTTHSNDALNNNDFKFNNYCNMLVLLLHDFMLHICRSAWEMSIGALDLYDARKKLDPTRHAHVPPTSHLHALQHTAATQPRQAASMHATRTYPATNEPASRRLQQQTSPPHGG